MAGTSELVPITLYSSSISDCAARVRLALNLKRLPYETITINLRKGETQDPKYGALNTSRTVPTLVIGDGVILTQSLAAIEYLDEVFPDTRLLPDNPLDRAKVRTLANIIATDTHPLTTHRAQRKSSPSLSGDKQREWVLYWITGGLRKFEAAVQDTAGTYSVGNAVTLADVSLIPELWTAERLGVDLSQYPALVRLYKALSAVDEIGNTRQDPSSEIEDSA